jgi:hypothetical protein
MTRASSRERTTSLVVGAAGTVTLVVAVIAAWLAATGTTPSDTFEEIVRRLLAGSWSLALAAVGLLILVRRSGNRIGWVALALALGVAVSSITSNLTLAVDDRNDQLVAVFPTAQDIAVLLSFPLLVTLILLFPDGRLPSRRWRPIAWAIVAWPVLTLLLFEMSPLIDRGNGKGPVPNPTGGIPGPVGDVAAVMAPLLNVGGLTLLLLAAVASVLVRFARSRGVERQQLKWFAYAAALLALSAVASALLPVPIVNALPNLVAFGLPIALAIAVLRYRLYDIDLLINRTVVYGATSATIAATFYLGIVALQAVLRPLTSGSELAVAASTLVSFALFQPIRRRIQGALDRRFDRSRYEAARTLDAFADRLRDEVDLDALREDLIGAVRQTMAPAHVSLWLRERGR